MKRAIVLLVWAAWFTGSLFGTSPSLKSLDHYLWNHGAFVTEGHIGGFPKKLKFFASLFKDKNKVCSVGETGFNAGHSSALFLSTYPSCTVVSFDIMDHQYASIGKQYIDQHFPGRHTIVSGDSCQSVPAFALSHPNTRFDLIFIDGGHTFPVAYSDITQMERLASPHTILVVDDINYPPVANAWESAVREGRVREIKRYKDKDQTWVQGVYVFRTK